MKKSLLFVSIVLILLLMLCTPGCGQSKEEEPIATATETETETQPVVYPVDGAWFDDAVFVGDSITLKLSYYCDEHPDALGKASFFCAGSLGYASALWDIDRADAVHPFYQGQTELTENCAALTGANKVFIMLGMNDVAVYGVDGTIENADELIGRILSHTPDVKIYIESVTPILYGHEYEDLNNEVIRAFNAALESYAADRDYPYLDIYHVVAGDDGYLRADYCGDEGAQGIHFTSSGCEAWIDYLKNHV